MQDGKEIVLEGSAEDLEKLQAYVNEQLPDLFKGGEVRFETAKPSGNLPTPRDGSIDVIQLVFRLTEAVVAAGMYDVLKTTIVNGMAKLRSKSKLKE